MFLTVQLRKYYCSLVNKVSRTAYQRWKKKKMEKLYGKFIQPGFLCFDIGANVGVFSQAFLDLGATVIAMEPVKETFNDLNARLNTNANITMLPVAVSSQNGSSK